MGVNAICGFRESLFTDETRIGVANVCNRMWCPMPKCNFVDGVEQVRRIVRSSFHYNYYIILAPRACIAFCSIIFSNIINTNRDEFIVYQKPSTLLLKSL